MGFRCPKCKKDFGYDREKLQEHFSENDACAFESVMNIVERNPTMASNWHSMSPIKKTEFRNAIIALNKLRKKKSQTPRGRK